MSANLGRVVPYYASEDICGVLACLENLLADSLTQNILLDSSRKTGKSFSFKSQVSTFFRF